jgi:hypothetical protein
MPRNPQLCPPSNIIRLHSSASRKERGNEAYFTVHEAVESLLHLERLPQMIWEPAAGDGAIVRPLRALGHTVFASDLADYGLDDCARLNYLLAPAIPEMQGIVTNPPFSLAHQFVEKALTEVPYVAVLARNNFEESVERLPLFRYRPYARKWLSSRRLPMMHRVGWTGRRASSAICFAWFVWDAGASQKRISTVFDWKEIASLRKQPDLFRSDCPATPS